MKYWETGNIQIPTVILKKLITWKKVGLKAEQSNSFDRGRGDPSSNPGNFN